MIGHFGPRGDCPTRRNHHHLTWRPATRNHRLPAEAPQLRAGRPQADGRSPVRRSLPVWLSKPGPAALTSCAPDALRPGRRLGLRRTWRATQAAAASSSTSALAAHCGGLREGSCRLLFTQQKKYFRQQLLGMSGWDWPDDIGSPGGLSFSGIRKPGWKRCQ
jgi:hypothetical protein